MSETLVVNVARDFLIRGASEPVSFHPLVVDAMREAIAIATALGVLDAAVDEVLFWAYELEGAGDSPEAARALRAIIAGTTDRRVIRELEARGKRLARARRTPTTGDRKRVRA